MRRRSLVASVVVAGALAGCGGPSAARPSPVIYFAVTDRFANGDPGNDVNVDRAAPGAYHGGDLAGLRANLPYLAALGVDVLWLSPVVDNIDGPVEGAGFPDWGYHGYWARDFERIDEHLGTEADLRALVEDAHARGLRVLLDVVLNHPGYGARWAADPAWTRTPERGDCGADPLTECLYGLPDFRTEDPKIADWLIDAHLGWAERSGVDGFRVDSALHVGLDVLARLAQRARAARGRDFFLLGEVWGAAPARAESAPYLRVFDALYDFEFADRAHAFVTGAEDAPAFARWLEARGPAAERFVVFLNTHDTPGFLYRVGADVDTFLLAVGLQMTIPGMPLVYYGDEVARRGGEWPENRSDMPWTPEEGGDVRVLREYKSYVDLHKRLAGPLRVVHAEGRVLAFERGERLVLVNAGTSHAKVTLRGVTYNLPAHSVQSPVTIVVSRQVGTAIVPGR